MKYYLKVITDISLITTHISGAAGTVNTLLDQQLSEDHQAALARGLEAFDRDHAAMDHFYEQEAEMTGDLQRQFELDRQSKEEVKAYWAANAFQDAQALNMLLDSPNATVEDCRSTLCKAVISLSKVRSLLMGESQ
mgnify:CR=1 FL=1